MDLKGAIDGIIEQGKLRIKANEGDYIGEDGLLYCGNCHTKKQTEVTIFGEIRRPMCLCKCQVEKRDAEERARKQREFQEQVSRMRQEGFPESDMGSWTFANDDRENEQLTKAMEKYVENFEEFRAKGKGLILWGEVGTGKTFAACEVANALIDKGYPVLVTNFARIANQLQGTFEKQEYIDRLNRYSLIVLDDLSSERNTEYMNEQIFQIIDARYRAQLPMIITTNLTMSELKNPQEIAKRRIYDRVLERCHPIRVSGTNKRKEKIKNDYADMQKMLGLE